MSTSHTIVIPTDPAWTPQPDRETVACDLIREFLPEHAEMTVERSGRVDLYTGVELFESIRCPACAAELDIQPWWTDRLDAAWHADTGFGSLEVTTPCCGAATSLNDLAYNTPQGFASWAVTVRDPAADLGEHQIQQIEDALGHPVRVVYAHL